MPSAPACGEQMMDQMGHWVALVFARSALGVTESASVQHRSPVLKASLHQAPTSPQSV